MNQANSDALVKLKDYPDVLNVGQVSVILNVNIKTVYKLIKEQQIKSIKVGRLHRITKKNVSNFLKS